MFNANGNGIALFFLSLACILLAVLLLIIGVIINAIAHNFTTVRVGLYVLLIGGILMLLSAAFCTFGGSQEQYNPRIDTADIYHYVDTMSNEPYSDTMSH
jgi:drug/metabolite transporter (DMT)-like permease